MTNLQPVDFKAVAAKGAFVYCYLRHSDSKAAAAYTPYYVGIAVSDKSGQRHRRPFGKHESAPVPVDHKFVRVMRSGLTEEQACNWERFYIAWFGREAEGGILLNQAEGGEVNGGWKHTEEWKENTRKRMQVRVFTPSHRAKISAAQKGKTRAPWTAERRSSFVASEKQIENARAIGKAGKGRKHTAETIEKMAAVKRGKLRSADCKLKIVETKARQFAAKIGVEVGLVLALNKKQRATLQQRVYRGWPVERLFEGFAAA